MRDDPWRVTITYRAAEIIAGLLPGRQEHLSKEAKQAITQFLGQVLRTRSLAEQPYEPDPDT